MLEPILLGKTLDTEDKVMAEVDELNRRIQKNRKVDSDYKPKDILFFQGMERWKLNSAGKPHASDLKAVMYSFQLQMSQDLASPGEHHELIEKIARS